MNGNEVIRVVLIGEEALDHSELSLRSLYFH